MVDFMLRNRRNTYHWREIIRIFVVILFDVSDYIFLPQLLQLHSIILFIPNYIFYYHAQLLNLIYNRDKIILKNSFVFLEGWKIRDSELRIYFLKYLKKFVQY